MTENVEYNLDDILAVRRDKLKKWRDKGAYPNQYKPDAFCGHCVDNYGESSKEELAAQLVNVQVAGRVMLFRRMGKASFIQIQDHSGVLQVYVRTNSLGELTSYEDFLSWDLGDIVWVSGELFKTNKGELSVYARDIILLSKALRPLPDKFHGLNDVEMCYRQRYLDLVANSQSRERFKQRGQIVNFIRNFLIAREFAEVETPMMHKIPGGAVARPFVTHHNALGMDLYLRVAPELYLKRLLVGGLDRVFEINRNFRNEGLSTRHNPEFTMLEFYQAYADCEDLINLSEELLPQLVMQLFNTHVVRYQEHSVDWTPPFARHTVVEAICTYNESLTPDIASDLDKLQQWMRKNGLAVDENRGLGGLQIMLFEETVETKLIQPTFITEYPTEVSPLARRNIDNGEITDRFELFVAGQEISNGFSELNDPDDQAERFRAQVAEREAGDHEAMYYDSDYITALEHGMPPAAGQGIGIDRLVMLLTNAPAIRDVILFPTLRPRGLVDE